MTPRGMIFTSLGLPVPQQNDIRTWLHVDGMAAHGSLRMINALRAENDNLRDGLRARNETIEELQEFNANQREYILELLAANKELQTRHNNAVIIAAAYANAITDYYAKWGRYRGALLAIVGTDSYEAAEKVAREALNTP